ncbi:hypothetical protein CEQ51_28075 [Pseudomonas thivervalensis]|uniref:Uncharacterized protein n=1 Tax=Pseudomonas thivervalensis TaxID=86265 RepID=A0A2Z4ZKG5_9PSED|nr:hypothetical protein CE140_28080 [Pseudomonas thivervalensis]AXA63768.1 hypothetical protein CEQ51_28075 [Pseudomonas thivervalensis]
MLKVFQQLLTGLAAKPFADVSDEETIGVERMAHKSAGSGVVVGEGARMRGLAEGLSNPSDAPYNPWRGSLLPLGCEAALKSCGRCAAEREQAPSPRGWWCSG